MSDAKKQVAGVVLLPPIAGLSDYTSRRARMLRGWGFEVEFVDYYSGGDPPDLSSPERIMSATRSLVAIQVMVQTARAADALRARGVSSVGVVGFCIGGTYAMLAGCQLTGVDAVVNFYGTVRHTEPAPSTQLSPLELAAQLSAPLLSHYGDADRFVPRSDVDALEGELDRHGKTHELFRYSGAPHAFDEDFRAPFRPNASREAWLRTRAHLSWYLMKEQHDE
ncbi:hypothetical protein BH09PSE5_BH09PSE5_28020 [soil metagenome]